MNPNRDSKYCRQMNKAKNLSIGIIFLIAVNTPAYGMKIVQSGVMGGVTVARLWGLQVSQESWNVGAWAGVYLLVPVADNFYFRPEVNFSMRGYRYLYENENDLQGDKSEAILRLNYIDFPFLFQFAISVNETLIPDVVFGPFLGWNISARSINIVGDSEISEKADNVRKYDLGLMAGGRLHYSKHVYINLRSGAGLLSIVDKPNPPRKYNLWIVAGLQYRF